MYPTVDRLRAALVRGAASSALAPRLVEQVGAHTLADRLDRRRGHGDIAAVIVPAAPNAWRTRRVKAWRHEGHDQCVEAFHQGGWWGYERPLADVMLATVRAAPGTVLDVGANTGVYALILATVPGVTVHAFEPYAPVAAMLRENLALNAGGRGGRNIVVVEAAASDATGTIDLFVPAATEAIETSCSIEHDFKVGAVATSVRSTTLDAYWSSIGEPGLTVIKMDVEGGEHRVLAGSHRILGQARPVAFYEVLPGAHFDQLEALRVEHDYVDVRLSQWEAVVNDRILFHELAWNHALVPAEKLAAFLEPLSGLGLRVTDLASPPA